MAEASAGLTTQASICACLIQAIIATYKIDQNLNSSWFYRPYRNGKLLMLGDEYDVTSLVNLAFSIDIMKQINEKRATGE